MKKFSQLRLCILLLAVFVVFIFIFQWATHYCCDETKEIHIIDIHVMKCIRHGWFDSAYVKKAAVIYNREKYKRSYLVADTIFPLVYSFLFFCAGLHYRRSKWYPAIIVLIAAGAFFDWGENFSFLSYLYHPSSGLAARVAFFTSLKSILFPLNFAIAIVLFVKGLILNKIK